MLVVEILVVAALAFGVAAVATGFGRSMSEEPRDRADPGIPADRLLRADDVAGLRFRVALRGYRMSDVDEALARLADALRAHEQPVTPAQEAGGTPGRGTLGGGV